MGKFTLYKSAYNNEFYYRLRASGNNEIILSGEGYTSRSACEKGIESVKNNSQFDSRYTKSTATNGNHYFTLKAANGEIIGKSEMYTSSFARDKGIEAVKVNAPTATLEYLA